MVCRLTLRFPSKLPPHPPTDRTQSPLSRATQPTVRNTSSLLLGARQELKVGYHTVNTPWPCGIDHQRCLCLFQLVTDSALPRQTVANAADLNLISWSPTTAVITLHAHPYISAAVLRGHHTAENSLGTPQAAYPHWYHSHRSARPS